MSAQDFDSPAPALLLFWAAWCAPCRAEIAEYPKLAAAAGTVPIIVVSLDTPRKRAEQLLAGVPSRHLRLTGYSTVEVMSSWPVAAGLPLTIALNGKGATCAVLNGRLTAHRVASLLSRCGASS